MIEEFGNGEFLLVDKEKCEKVLIATQQYIKASGDKSISTITLLKFLERKLNDINMYDIKLHLSFIMSRELSLYGQRISLDFEKLKKFDKYLFIYDGFIRSYLQARNEFFSVKIDDILGNARS